MPGFNPLTGGACGAAREAFGVIARAWKVVSVP